MKILVIDDDNDLRDFLSHRLRSQGHTVAVRPDGSDVEHVLLSSHPDVVITDILMENMDGFETVRAIRENIPSIYVIAMSGNELYLHFIERLGADAVLLKPFKFSQIEECLTAVKANNAGQTGRMVT